MDSHAVFPSTGPQGHRARMRERLLRGKEALADYEILEMLLFLCISRRDTKPLAKHLINRFGSLSAVLEADPAALAAACGLDADTLSLLRMPAEAASRLALADDRTRPVLDTWHRLLDYFVLALQGAVPGDLRMLLLDNRNRLLADEPLRAAPERMAFVLAGRALHLHATALVLVRVLADAPTDPLLLQREAALASGLAAAIAPLAIVLHDHMLVGGGAWISLRQRHLL